MPCLFYMPTALSWFFTCLAITMLFSFILSYVVIIYGLLGTFIKTIKNPI
jgi:hypothetical protein